MPANWVLLAIPLSLLCLTYWVYDGIRNHLERRYLHAVFDGDRIQEWKSHRYLAKHHRAARSGQRFY